VLTFEDNNFLEKDIADKVTGEWKAIYKVMLAKTDEFT
jgi:hypothetical protein